MFYLSVEMVELALKSLGEDQIQIQAKSFLQKLATFSDHSVIELFSYLIEILVNTAKPVIDS